jgi:uncharacterized protein YutE (UPF0331/DUF86 family)
MSAVRGIAPKLEQLAKECGRLESYRQTSLEGFLEDPSKQEDTVYLFFTTCQWALEIGTEILDDLGSPPPRGETEIFSHLADEEVLSEVCVSQLRAMHGLCDALSEQYDEIDPRWVYQTLQVNLDGLSLFVRQVQAYLDQ